jgi:hypothetical protein
MLLIALTSQHMPFAAHEQPHRMKMVAVSGFVLSTLSSLTRPALPGPEHVAPAAEGASEVRSAPVTLRAAHPALRSAMSASGAEWKQGQQCSAFCTVRRTGKKQSR